MARGKKLGPWRDLTATLHAERARWLAEDLGAPEGEEAARDSVAQNVALDAALLPQKLDGYRIWIRVSAEQLATLRATLDV